MSIGHAGLCRLAQACNVCLFEMVAAGKRDASEMLITAVQHGDEQLRLGVRVVMVRDGTADAAVLWLHNWWPGGGAANAARRATQ